MEKEGDTEIPDIKKVGDCKIYLKKLEMWVGWYPQACGAIHTIHLHLVCLSFSSTISVLLPINNCTSDVSSNIEG